MAAANVIEKALQDVMGHAYVMDNVLTVLDQINGELGEAPRWVQMMRDQYRPLYEALEVLETAIGREAMPILRDIAAIGGMGAMAPMVTKVVDRQSDQSRT
ncbi:MAG: hypothetical protein ACT6UH_16210 [Hydrogenophaga sp.]|uniref:hypothetical protein n=1 Tax=Hydrogenophaga sp. TaxID=1904254 RepID=UPI00403508AB